MLKSSLYDYSDAYILVKGKITIRGAGADAATRQADERDKGIAFKKCAPFINCISEINNTQVENAKDIDIVMPMYNLIEYSDNYAKTTGSLWQYFRDEPDDDLEDSELFKSKIKITGKTPDDDNEKDVEITKNADTSKYNYKGYGTCFDKDGTFSKGNINNGRNVLIFGVHESSLVHANNKANNIYVIGDIFVQ